MSATLPWVRDRLGRRATMDRHRRVLRTHWTGRVASAHHRRRRPVWLSAANNPLLSGRRHEWSPVCGSSQWQGEKRKEKKRHSRCSTFPRAALVLAFSVSAVGWLWWAAYRPLVCVSRCFSAVISFCISLKKRTNNSDGPRQDGPPRPSILLFFFLFRRRMPSFFVW